MNISTVAKRMVEAEVDLPSEADLGDGLKLVNNGEGNIKVWKNQELVGSFYFNLHHRIPSLDDARAYERGLGIARRVIKFLLGFYPALRSSHSGNSSYDAAKAWDALGAVALWSDEGGTLYGRSHYVLFRAEADKQAFLSDRNQRMRKTEVFGGVSDDAERIADLGDGYTLFKSGIKAFEVTGPHGRIVANLRMDTAKKVPSVQWAGAFERGKGLVRRALKALVQIYGSIRSSRFGDTNAAAEAAWKAVGAVPLTPQDSRELYGDSMYVLFRDEADKQAFLSARVTEALGDDPKNPVHWKLQTPGRWKGDFNVGGVDYQFSASVMDDRALGRGIWTISFAAGSSKKTDITGTGNSSQVFSTVIDALRQFITKVQPPEMVFQGMEPSRKRLYTALIARMAEPLGYEPFNLAPPEEDPDPVDGVLPSLVKAFRRDRFLDPDSQGFYLRRMKQ